MREVYRKAGRVVRFENGVLVRVDESGEAIEEDRFFSAAPVAGEQELPSIDTTEMLAAVAGMRHLPIERIVVSEGIAFHAFGHESWSEVMRRLHVSIAVPPYRALIDLATFSSATIERVAGALAKVSGERERPRRIRLADHVGAALLPHLCGRINMQQWAAPHDGKGAWVENLPVEGQPPNWFRPSYRTRPMRAWLNLRVDPLGAVDRQLPEAIALLAPVHAGTLHVLCVDGRDVYGCKIDATAVIAAEPAAEWYPYGAGCFGAELVL